MPLSGGSGASGASSPLYQFQSSQSRYVPRSRKYTELERLTSVLRKHNVDCSTVRRAGQAGGRGKLVTPASDPARCTHSSHRCHHAAHAYTAVPCSRQPGRRRARGRARQAAQLPRLPSTTTSSSTGRAEPVTVKIKAGAGSSQAVRLPTDKLEQNKKYYVTFTLKPKPGGGPGGRRQVESYQRGPVQRVY